MRWLDQFDDAVRSNLHLLHVMHSVSWLTPTERAQLTDLVRHAARGRRGVDAMAGLIRALITYGFDGLSHEVMSYLGSRQRRYWACTDGAALAAAAALEAGQRPALCYETVEGVTRYAHSRVLIVGAPVEPWPEVRLEVRQCSMLVDVAVRLRAL